MPESNDKPNSDNPLAGLPADWAMSRVTLAPPQPATTQLVQPVQPVTPIAVPLASPAPAAPVAAQVAAPAAVPPRPLATESASPQTAMLDSRVFGALGQWQERVAHQEPARRAPSHQPTRLHGAMPADVGPTIHYAPPVNPPVAPIAELRQPQPQPQPEPQPQLQPQPVEARRTPEPAPMVPAAEEVLAEPDADVPPARHRRTALRLSSLAFWRAATALFVVISVVLAVMLFKGGPSFEVGLAPIGQVSSPAPVFLAEAGKSKLRVTPLADIEVPKENDLQLWMFQPNSERAISLGVLPAGGGVFTPPVALQEGARFVISLEPHGGTTNGRISGNVLYGGMLANR